MFGSIIRITSAARARRRRGPRARVMTRRAARAASLIHVADAAAGRAQCDVALQSTPIDPVLRDSRMLATALLATCFCMVPTLTGGSELNHHDAAPQPIDCDLPRIVIDIYNDPL